MKKSVLIIILAVIFALYPVRNFVSLANVGNEETTIENSGEAYLKELSDYDIKKAQSNVKKAKGNSVTKPTSTEVKEVLKKLSQGKTTYRKVFRNVYIVGDSLMNGLQAYNILNSNRLITQVSASLYHLSDNVNKIVKAAPQVLILHYGVNMISTNKNQLNTFISMYTRLIKQIQKGSPDTRIIVSGLFPVDTDVAKAKRFTKIGVYNKALVKMCDELKIEFLDSSSVLKAHPECYGGDGIHLSKAFYEKYWLKFIISEMGITG